MSKRTKRYRNLRNIFSLLSFICTYGIVLFSLIYGLSTGEIAQKYTICISAIGGMALGLVCAILKKHWLTPVIVMLIGIYLAIDNFKIILLFFAIGTMLDELIFHPLVEHFKSVYIINKEIDRRG